MKIKQSIGIIEKIDMIRDIVNLSFTEIDGKTEFSAIYHEIACNYYVVKAYTGIKLVQETIEDEDGTKTVIDDILASYDKIVKNDIYNQVIEGMDERERIFILKHIENAIDERECQIIESKNLVNMLKDVLHSFGENIPDMVNALKNIKPDQYEQLQAMLNIGQKK